MVLLLPSLFFSVSALVGPFLLAPKPGRHLGRLVWLPKLLGWSASFVLYALAAWLIARGGPWEGAGAGLLLVAFGFMAVAALRYVGYPTRVRRLAARLERRLQAGGLEAGAAGRLAHNLLRQLGGEPEKAGPVLQRTALSPENHANVLAFLRSTAQPLLKRPLTDVRASPDVRSRFGCELRRSFVLGSFTFIWFFIVPIPGLLVFTAPGGYQLSMPLSTMMAGLTALVAAALAGLGASLAVEGWITRQASPRGLPRRIAALHGRFETLIHEPGRLTEVEVASLYALFTDTQTYFDQRSYAYSGRALRLIERILRGAATR